MPSTIQLGAQSQDVATARAMLEQLGYAVPGEPTVFGPTMQAAVISFQKDNGLQADGVVGPNTWAALQQRFAESAGTEATGPVQRTDFTEGETIIGEVPKPNSTALWAGLIVAVAVWYFSSKEQKEGKGATGEWEDEEAPEIKRRVRRIDRTQKKLKKRPSGPIEEEPMEIKQAEERGDIVVYTNSKMFKSQRNYREEVKSRADDQAADTGRTVKIVDSKSPGKVLYEAEA